MSATRSFKIEEPEDRESVQNSLNQPTAGVLPLKAMGKRQKSGPSECEPQGRDVESHDSTPEAISEPEVKRRKAAQPCKVKQPPSNDGASPLPSGKRETSGGGGDTETRLSTATAVTDTAQPCNKRETPPAGNGSAMIVHGFNHEFELEVDVEATLRNVIRLIQPSLNFDLSKAAISLRGEHELTLDTRLRYFVRGGSQGVVKVKLVIVRKPGENLRVTIMDVLQAEPIPTVIRYPTPPTTQHMPVEVSPAKKASRKITRKSPVSKGQTSRSSVDTRDWVTSESFTLLRTSLGLPLDPVEWDQSHVSHWLAWATKSFALPELNVVLFSQLSGEGLRSLSREMFSILVGKDEDDLFWTHFEILRTSKRAAVLARRPTPESSVPSIPPGKVPIKRLNKSTGSKKPLTMSDGWKNRDDEFFPENAGSIQLWQFLLETLAAGQQRNAIEWTGEPGEFVLIEPERVAELWGKRKNKDNMNYEKMSRALRYYYGGDILAKVPGKHYTYRFVCDLSAAGYSGQGLPSQASTSSSAGSSSPPTCLSSQPSSPSFQGSVADSDGSVDVPVRSRKPAKSQRVGSLASALESIRQRHERSVSQVAA